MKNEQFNLSVKSIAAVNGQCLSCDLRRIDADLF